MSELNPVSELRTPGAVFADRFTVMPDTGITELHCYLCDEKWPAGYHPSLDVLIEHAQAHNDTFHPGRVATVAAYIKTLTEASDETLRDALYFIGPGKRDRLRALLLEARP